MRATRARLQRFCFERPATIKFYIFLFSEYGQALTRIIGSRVLLFFSYLFGNDNFSGSQFLFHLVCTLGF